VNGSGGLSWYSPAAANEFGARKSIYRHDRRATQQTAKLNHLAYAKTGYGNNAHRRGFVIHHADCHLIGNDGRNCFRGG